jgi:hypothetical protein
MSGLYVWGRFVHDIICVCVAGEAWDEWDEEKGFIPVIHWSAESALGTNRIACTGHVVFILVHPILAGLCY